WPSSQRDRVRRWQVLNGNANRQNWRGALGRTLPKNPALPHRYAVPEQFCLTRCSRRMLSRNIPVSLPQKSNSLCVNPLPSRLCSSSHNTFWWPVDFFDFLLAFQMVDLETQVILALVMWSQDSHN
ncbi:Hypothetical predicted protein, partial [Lynx pardinus]